MTPLEIPPGVVHRPTKASSSTNWRETNLMRWNAAAMEPMGGWEKYAYPAFASRVRATHDWVDNAGNRYTAYLCEYHVYVDIGGTLTDISPVPGLEPPYGVSPLDGGYGDNIYGFDEYGTPRPPVDKTKAITPVYTLDNWGEELLIMTSADGRLLRWRPSVVGDIANPVPSAPISNRTFVVTPERHVMLFGFGGDPRSFCWSDQEDYTNWNFASVTSKAGFYNVEPASPIVCAKGSRDGVLFATAVKIYMARYVGLPFVYSYEEIADAATPISAASIQPAANGLLWVSASGVWAYNGSSVAPVECPVWDWVVDDIDDVYTRYEAAAVNIRAFSEFWWFFPQKDQRYNTRFICYNYRDGWWSMGRLSRSCGLSSSYTTYPIMSDGYSVYKHESGNLYPGSPELPWAETFSLGINAGDRVMTVLQMMPDIEGSPDGVQFSWFYKYKRSGNDELQSPKRLIRENGYVDFRVTGRDFRLRVDSVGPAVGRWTMGKSLVEIAGRGKR